MATQLTLDQSRHILGVLSTLEHLPYFKMIFYPDKIELGSDFGALRATTQFFSSLISSETSRDLSQLEPLIARVPASFLTQENLLFNDYSRIREDIGLIEKAIVGLHSLQGNQYGGETEKQVMILSAVQTLRATKAFFSKKGEAYLAKNGGLQKYQESEEKKEMRLVIQDQTARIAQLELEIAHAKKQLLLQQPSPTNPSDILWKKAMKNL